MLLGISETANVRTFKPLPLCSAPWKLTGRDFWSSRNERKQLYKEKCVLRKCCGVSPEMVNARAVCKSSLLWYWWGPLPKVGSSAMCCVLLFMASLSGTGVWGVHWLKWAHLPLFVYWYSRHRCSGTGGSISQSRFICHVVCTGMQGISALLPGGSIGQGRFICQVLCAGIQGISALVLGGFLELWEWKKATF